MQGLDPFKREKQLKPVHNNKYGLGGDERSDEARKRGCGEGLTQPMQSRNLFGLSPAPSDSPVQGLLRTSLPSGILNKILSPPTPLPPPTPLLNPVTPSKDKRESTAPSPIANDESVTIDIEIDAGSGAGLVERQVDQLVPAGFMSPVGRILTPPRNSGKKPPLSPYSTGPSKKVLKAQKKKEKTFNKYLQGLQSHTITPDGQKLR